MKLGKWISLFGAKYNQYLDELGEMGESTARFVYSTAPADTGNTDVTVTREYDGAGNFRIRATGHDAMFMEFGTGVMTTITRPTVQSDVPIEDGSWSREVGGEYAKFGDYWHWNKERWTGTPPLGGMQEACAAMEQWSSTIAGRVFG